MKILVSNGTNRFHMAALAASLQKKQMLAGFLAAGWPVGWQKRLAMRFPDHDGWQRFLDRAEPIDEGLIYSFAQSEALTQGARLTRRHSNWLAEQLDCASHRWYARSAGYIIKKLRPAIYHYRSCFGLSSVQMAKTCGAITLCDHSIAHPAVLSYMVDHAGQLPLPDKVGPVSRLELRMQEDLSKAEHVLVNSDFVKQTCVYAGMDADRIHVIYTGLEDKYLQGVPEFNRQQVEGRGSTVMYAGALQVRKGLWPLIEVFSGRAERPITIVGNAEPALREEERVVSFLASDNVNPVGILSRVQLAKLMTEHSIFVFPSLCEGSARVVFEAMACGCFIITTANSGSIVRDGVHGLVVPPGDASALAEAVDWANANPVRVAEIGWENAKLVRREYRQDHYVAKVMDLYGRLVAKQRALAVTV